MESDSRPKIYLRDRLYVPAEYVTEDMLLAYEDTIPLGKDLVTGEEITETIQHYQREEILRDDLQYAFNRGDIDKIYRIFGERFQIVDERVSVDMIHDLQIVFPEGKFWRDWQPDAVSAMLSREDGLLKAPARSGKTLMVTAVICADRQKSIIIAHQTDLLVQFLSTFEEYTNLLELRKQTGSRIVGIAEDWDDFDDLDVVLCTKQTFDHFKNKMKLPYIQRLFGAVFVDEAHMAPAEMYSMLVNRFWAKRRQGGTATPERKDGLHVVVAQILGPIVHEIRRDSIGRVPGYVQYHMSPLTMKKGMGWVKLLSYLAKSDTRNQMIADLMKADVEAGHFILAVSDRREQINSIRDKLASYNISCHLFTGDLVNKAKRLAILQDLREGRVPVLLAMRSMTTGLDVPRVDTFYNLLPTANAVGEGDNQGEGGYEQQCSRPATQFPGKTHYMIRDIIDNIPICWGCLKSREKTYRLMGVQFKNKQEKKEPSQRELFVSGGSSTEF